MRILKLLIVLLSLAACTGPDNTVTVNIAQPATDLATNTNVALKLEISNFNPDQFSTLTVVIERKKTTDPDTAYAPLKVFEKTDPYPFAFTWNPTNEPDGAYTLRARATYQKAGFGGSSATISTTRSVTFDRQAPSVTDRTPTPDAKDVSVRAPIRVTFSEPVAPGSLTDDSVKVSSGNTILARKLEQSSDGKTLTIAPSSTITAPATVNVTLGNTLTDTVGNKLGATSWVWNAPEFVPVTTPIQPTTKISQPMMVLDRKDQPAIITTEEIPVMRGSSRVTSTLSTNRYWTGTWEPNGEGRYSCFSDPLKSNATNPVIVFDSQDVPVVACQEGNTVFVNGFPDAVFTSPPNQVSTLLNYPSLAIDIDGKTIIAYLDTTGSSVYAWKLSGSTWTALGGGLRDSSTVGAQRPTLRRSTDNSLTIASREERQGSSITDVYVRRWTGLTWALIGNSAIPNSNLVSTIGYPVAMSFDAAGNPWVSILVGDVASRTVAVRRWDGSTWQEVGGALAATPAGINNNISFNALALDAAGTAFVAWIEEASGVPSIYLRQRVGTEWKAIGNPLSARLPGRGTSVISDLSLVLDSSGTPVLAWLENGAVYIYRYNR